MAAPTPPVANDWFRVRFLCTQGPQTAVNVRYYRLSSYTVAAPSWQDLADAFCKSYSPRYSAVLNNNATFWGVKLDPKLDDGIPWEPIESRLFTIIGVGGADPLPDQTCGIFTCKSGISGRANRGRQYIPFPATDGQEFAGGYPRPNAAYMVNLGFLAARFSGPFLYDSVADIASTYTCVAGIWRPVPGARIEFTTATARQKWATQRRRGAYGRENAP